MNFEFKMVIIARKDLKLTKGKLAAQAAHAAVTCSNIARREHTDWYDKWIFEGQKKVVLEVEGREEMFKFYVLAKEGGLPCCTIRDAGMTEIPPGTITVAGIGPAPENLIDKITGELKLL
ncbi:MAG: peptidyl-tRNA hydrolase [Candidatus Methanofastidiosa archaeon]|nr:peptidyl-tRNA hydrolase [Candidatus Methanofastidiosa archaeon]